MSFGIGLLLSRISGNPACRDKMIQSIQQTHGLLFPPNPLLVIQH